MDFKKIISLSFNKNLIKHYSTNLWVKPTGYDTGIKIYNCITKQKEPLILRNKNVLTWYTCGPTVYDSAHIGHASCYMKLDIIQNVLKNFFNINLVTVMNITDIDDKIIQRSNEKKLKPAELAKHYETEFWEDIKSLGIDKPDTIIRVMENCNLVIKFIERLLANGLAYKAADNSVYLDITKAVQHYGKLQNIGKAAGDGENSIKKASADFVLWKAKKEDEPFWESPWGPGRPGWHIECSALATHVLGPSIDVHAGGIDLRFPHHENEEAISCAFHQKDQWVNYWVHTGHLHLKNSEKMSKSLKNTISIREMLKNTSPQAFRMACAMTHYRSPMEYSEELLETANNNLKSYKNFMNTADVFKKGLIKASLDNNKLKAALEETSNTIQNAIRDDFDTPSVINALNKFVTTINTLLQSSQNPGNGNNPYCDMTYVIASSNFVRNILQMLNFRLESEVTTGDEADNIMEVFLMFRNQIREKALQEKNTELLKICDVARDELKECGIFIKDYKNVSSWSR